MNNQEDNPEQAILQMIAFTLGTLAIIGLVIMGASQP